MTLKVLSLAKYITKMATSVRSEAKSSHTLRTNKDGYSVDSYWLWKLDIFIYVRSTKMPIQTNRQSYKFEFINLF